MYTRIIRGRVLGAAAAGLAAIHQARVACAPAPLAGIPVGMGAPVGTVFTAADLINGNALVAPVVPTEAAAILTTAGLGAFTRHLATMENAMHIGLQTISDLGLTRGYHVGTTPAMTLAYCADILALDAVPEMTDPGPQGGIPGGGRLAPGALVHAVREAVLAATAALTALTRAGAGGGSVTHHGSGASTSRDRARDLTIPEIQNLQNKFRDRYHHLPPQNEVGDAKTFGLADYYIKQLHTYPVGDCMHYLKIRPDGADGTTTTTATLENGQLTLRNDDGASIVTTNATQHVEAFTRKVNTILLVCMGDDMLIRAHQDGTGSSDPTRQMSLDDAQSVLGLLRENQRLVTKDAMASAINTFEKEVKMLHVGQEMLTLGGAYKRAATPLRQYLQLHYSASVSANTAATAAGLTKVPNPQGQDMHKAQMQSQINKLKAAAAGRGGRGRGKQQQYYNYAPQQQQQPYYGPPHPPPTPPGKGKGKGGRAQGGRGGPGAGGKDTHGEGSIGPSGLTRHVGGNPNGPTCPDWAAGSPAHAIRGAFIVTGSTATRPGGHHTRAHACARGANGHTPNSRPPASVVTYAVISCKHEHSHEVDPGYGWRVGERTRERSPMGEGSIAHRRNRE